MCKHSITNLAEKEVSTVPRMLSDRVADVRHHTQLSPGNCVNRMNLQQQV